VIKWAGHGGVSKSFRTMSITKYTFTTINTRLEATQRVMAAKLTRLTHKITIQLHLVAESCIICSSHSRRPVRKFLDTPSYVAERADEKLKKKLVRKYTKVRDYFVDQSVDGKIILK
jgi:hypothetical protein